MTALMRMVGAVLGVGTVQFFAADFVALVPAGNTGLSITIVGLAVTLAWAIFTWFRGATVSSSHALTASITGGAIALSVLETNHLGLAQLSPVGIGIGISLLASPLLAAATTWLIAAPVTFLFKDTAPHRVGYGSRGALAITAAANGLGHGVQYGQRMYIVMLMTLTAGGFNPGSMRSEERRVGKECRYRSKREDSLE